MGRVDSFKAAFLAATIGAAAISQGEAQGRPPLRFHDETQAQVLALQPADIKVGPNEVDITIQDHAVRLSSNAMPDHLVGRFPNRSNPNTIQPQALVFTVPGAPAMGPARPVGLDTFMGVAVNGVPFDPAAAEFWHGDRRSGWQYDALGGATPLGLDANHAHVQRTGLYHYHGLPRGLMDKLGWSGDAASPLIGWASDGFPIYALTAEIDGKVKTLRSSYRLQTGERPGGAAPDGTHDGAFQQDYIYVPGAGDLDECNGAYLTTTDYPDGTYAYVLTVDYPVVPRCLKGMPHASFRKR